MGNTQAHVISATAYDTLILIILEIVTLWLLGCFPLLGSSLSPCGHSFIVSPSKKPLLCPCLSVLVSTSLPHPNSIHIHP